MIGIVANFFTCNQIFWLILDISNYRLQISKDRHLIALSRDREIKTHSQNVLLYTILIEIVLVQTRVRENPIVK